MIKNLRQLGVTKKQIKHLKTTLLTINTTFIQIPKTIYQAMIAGIKSRIKSMEKEVREYKKNK